jgi:hypothetical protein
MSVKVKEAELLLRRHRIHTPPQSSDRAEVAALAYMFDQAVGQESFGMSSAAYETS